MERAASFFNCDVDVSRAQSLSKAVRAVVEKAKEEAKAPGATKQQKELAESFTVIFDGLRHSFISYRVAIVKDFPQVAMEAGNSVEVIQSHYNKRATEKEAKQFFRSCQGLRRTSCK